MKATRLFILIGIFLLSLGLVSGVLAAANAGMGDAILDAHKLEIQQADAPPELWIDSTYNSEVLPGQLAEFTLEYGNTGVNQSYVAIENLFPAEAPFVSSVPPPSSVSPDNLFVKWDFPNGIDSGITGTIAVNVEISTMVMPSSTIVITDIIYDQREVPTDNTIIEFHVRDQDGDPQYDLGDAPDSTNHYGRLMTAYPPGGPPGIVASFPTVFDPATGLPPGPRHSQPSTDAWLGLNVTKELDADLMPDADGVPNIDPLNDNPDRDVADDGIILGTMNLSHCQLSSFWVMITVPPGASMDPRYLNVWFDWNQDGDWGDVRDCPANAKAPEWAVQNHSLLLGPGVHVIQTPAFIPFQMSQAIPQQWVRLTLSEQVAPTDPASGLADGRGPYTGYQYGETEDYYIAGWVPPDVGWDKWINDEPWFAGISVTVETSDTIQVVDVIYPPQTHNVELVERWNPDHLQLIDHQLDIDPKFTAGISTGHGVMTWTIPESAGVVTITKFFHVEPCDWEVTILEEEFYDPQYADPVFKPVIIYKQPPQLSIDSIYNTDAYAGGISNFTLVYSNTGGYENDVWIRNQFPPEAPFYSSTPGPSYVAVDGSEAIWELGDLAMGVTGGIDVQVLLTETLEVSTTIEIWDGIFNHVDELADETWIKLHVEENQDYDIYIKDNTSDDGSVPSSTPYWLSPDIWVRHSKDGGLTHQNPVPGGTNFVYVRVRNRMATAVSDTKVDVYWTSAALGIGWPAGWGYIGFFMIPSLAPGAEYIGWVMWDTPTIEGHFCLRVRADSPDDPIGSGPDTIAPVDAVKNNNNISMRNLNIIDYPEVRECGYVTTTVYTEKVYMDAVNLRSTTASVDIVLDSDDFPLANGEIVLDPGALWGRWNALANFDQVGMTLIPTGFPAVISDVLMTPAETAGMTMTLTAEGDAGFTIDVEERVNGKLVGGIQYVRVLPDCALMPLISYTLPPTTTVSSAYLPSSDRFGWVNTHH